MAAIPTQITFHFEKSAFFRVIHADGAFGGLSPQGQIQIHFFSERFPIPQRIEQEILPTGAGGTELDRTAKDGVVREVESSVVMTLDVAKRVHQWLGEHIQNLEKVLSPGESEGEK